MYSQLRLLKKLNFKAKTIIEEIYNANVIPNLFPVKPISINITAKPKQFVADVEYSINCEVDGSMPETDIRWTQNNRPFTRGKVRS